MAGNFEMQINGFVNNTRQKVNRTIREIVFGLDHALDKNSPVGQKRLWQHPNSAPPGYIGGHFRANWQFGVDFMPINEIEGTNYQGNVERHKAQMPQDATGHIYYLVNNTPYAQALENGHSTQAPGPQAIMGRALVTFPMIVRQSVSG
jgi:hypothetical protein